MQSFHHTTTTTPKVDLLWILFFLLLALLSGPVAAAPHSKIIFDGIPRVHGLTDDEFFQKYFQASQPVILMDATKDWKAHEEWTLEKLRDRFGSHKVQVQMDRNSNHRFEEDKMRHRKDVEWSKFVDMVAATEENPTNDFYLTALNHVTDRPEFRSLLDDCAPIGNIVTWPPPKGSSNFWLGPKGTVTPMHYDPPNLVHTHIKGHKRWYLVDAKDAPKICSYETWFSHFDPTDPGDYSKCPTARDVTVYEAVLGPGETLFVPGGWYHFVEGLDISATISFTHFTRSSPRLGRTHPYLQPEENEDSSSEDGKIRLKIQNPTPEGIDVEWQGRVISHIPPHSEGSINTWSGHRLTTKNGDEFLARLKKGKDQVWILSGSGEKEHSETEMAEGSAQPNLKQDL